jgi:hypothetical protein
MEWKRALLPDMWLEAAELISHIILSSSAVDGAVEPADSITVPVGVISASEILAIIMISSGDGSASQAALCVGFGGGGAVT